MAEKKPEKKKAPSGRFKLYKAGKSAARSCPKCGDGFLMAQHKDRAYCGKCHYTEFGKK